jgi:hypothetical protein
MIAQLRFARRTELARGQRHSLPAAPRQLGLILDDARLGDDAGGAPSRAEGAGAASARGERCGERR